MIKTGTTSAKSKIHERKLYNMYTSSEGTVVKTGLKIPNGYGNNGESQFLRHRVDIHNENGCVRKSEMY